MMRQYELVERVQRYKPDVNEALLNKAYVYAMQKHGHQRRASGDPYFSHPLPRPGRRDPRLLAPSSFIPLAHPWIVSCRVLEQLFFDQVRT